MAKNNERTQKKMIQELYTAVLGVPGTAEQGLVGDVKAAFREIKELRTRHNGLSRRVWILIGALIGSGVGVKELGLLGG